MKAKFIFYNLALILAAGLVGCSKDLDNEDFLASEATTIEGFNVNWKAHMTEEQRQVVGDILADMVLVKGGIFTMGANPAYDPDARVNEQPAHLVKLTDYYICAHELTYDQVHTIIDMTTRSSNISEFKNKYLYYSWEDWKFVLELLTYYTGIEFSFPSEAQWEFAARGGSLSKGYKYPGSNNWDEVYADDLNSADDTVPNELGLYNMANRRGEWCADVYANYIDGPMPTNPLITVGDGHVVRGGCHISTGIYRNWHSTSRTTNVYYSDTSEDMRMSRSAARAMSKNKSWDIGCRPVINIK